MQRALLVSVAMLVVSEVAQAQPEIVCAPRSDIVDTLRHRHGEVQQTTHVISGGDAILEIWAAPVTRTWTLLRTSTEGISCVVKAGKNFHAALAPRRLETGAPQ